MNVLSMNVQVQQQVQQQVEETDRVVGSAGGGAARTDGLRQRIRQGTTDGARV